MDNKEYRYRKDITVKSEEDKPRTISGYAVVYNSPSEDLGGFTEVVLPGAFAEALKSNDLRALVDHDWGRLLGRQSSGTLRLFDGPDGLRYEIDLPDTRDALDCIALIERGDLDGMSFLMNEIEDRWEGDVRYIVKANIHEISVVSSPAYTDTSIAIRSKEKAFLASVGDEIRKLRQKLAEIVLKEDR